MSGWIKLHRKITEKAIWQDPQMLKLWLYCLIRANHTETETMVDKQEIKLQPGQFVTGRYALADDYNRGAKKRHRVSPDTLWRWLKKFEEWGMLHIKSTNKYSVITIKNWHAYQQTAQEMHNRCTTDAHQVHTDKNVKNVKNDKDIVPTEQPGGCEQDPPNKQQVIAELVTVYRSIRGVVPRKTDYPFLGKLFNDYGAGEVYGAIKALERKMESGPVSDTYSYLRATARAKAAEAAAKVTPLRRQPQTQHPLIPPGYNMPSLEDLERQRQVEAEMEAIRQERLRRRREMNGA